MQDMDSLFFVICVIPVILTDASKGSTDSVSLPLVDNMNAALTANINMSAMNLVLKEYIDQVVEERVMAFLNGTISSMNNRMEEMNSKVVNRMKDYDATVTNHLSNFGNERFSKVQSDIKAAVTEHNELVEKVSELESKVIKDQNTCAFLVGLDESLTNLKSGAVIVYEDVKLNVGECYSKSSGKFTAQENGLYMFSWTNASDRKQDFTSSIVKNGVRIATNVVDSDSVSDTMTGSSTVVVEMKKGESVWLRVHNSDGKQLRAKWGGSISIFTGFEL